MLVSMLFGSSRFVLTSSLCSACTSNSFCACIKSLNILATRFRHSISAANLLLYAVSRVTASFTWRLKRSALSLSKNKNIFSSYIKKEITTRFIIWKRKTISKNLIPLLNTIYIRLSFTSDK